jgi:prepilin-type N-terminal cleavage/methylation domain-containing protein
LRKFNLWSGLKVLDQSTAGFTLVEAMVAIAILAIGLLGVGYTLNVSSFIDQGSIQALHRPTDAQGKVGVRDNFNNYQSTVYGTLK